MMDRKAMILWVLLTATGVQNMKAQTMSLHLVGRPCLAKNMLSGVTVADRATGRELFIVTNSSEVSGLELLVIDAEQNTARVIKAPAGQGAWGIREVPGDRLVIGTYYDGTFLIFDLKKMEFAHAVKMPGEEYIWTLALGGDGRVYGGTYPGGKLIALDLETLTIEDCGNPAPPNMYLQGLSTLPDGRIIGNFGFEKPVTMIYDPASKTFMAAPDRFKGCYGMSWGDMYLTGSGASKGRDLEPVSDYPMPTPPPDKGGWYLDVQASLGDTLCLRQGNAIYLSRKGQAAAELLADFDLRGGRLLGGSRHGVVLGVRGQDYFVIRKGDTALQLRPVPVAGSPRPILFLRSDPRGRLWCGPIFGQTLCMLDPATGQTLNTGTVCDAGGEVYDVAFSPDGKVYTASYSGGDITEYDPAAPWDQLGNKNPRLLDSIGSRGYIRPVGGIKLGPDGLLYSGWSAKYGTYGGAIAITDPRTGRTDLIENPLGEQTVEGLAVSGKKAYVGTALGANGLPKQPNASARFGVVDLETRKVIFQKEFEGASRIHVMGLDARTGLVLVAVDGRIELFDSATLAFTNHQFIKPIATSRTCVMLGDGAVLYASKKKIVRLDLAVALKYPTPSSAPAATGEPSASSGPATASTSPSTAPSTPSATRTVASGDTNIENVARTPDGRLFASAGADVYEVK
jgi:WD40 repeat protein